MASSSSPPSHQLPLALSALGGMALFLKDGMLDKAVLSLGRIDLLPGTQVGLGAHTSTHMDPSKSRKIK